MQRRFQGRAEQALCRAYLGGTTVEGLAEKHHCAHGTVRATLVRNGIAIRPPGGKPPTKLTERDFRGIIARYSKGETMDTIAARYHVHVLRISRIVREAGLYTGRQGGPQSPGWKGGRHINRGGYVVVWTDPDDPIAGPMAHGGGRGYALEHRVVMARHLGRSLRPSETVHHVNGNRADNRIENLQLRSGKHGNGHALRCRACGSADIEAVELAATA